MHSEFSRFITSKINEKHPVDLSMWSVGYEQLGYDAFVYTSLQPEFRINVTILVILTYYCGTVSGIQSIEKRPG
ncbi:MAG: hypothetical protein R2764_25425 [Bacteroidales bacterium]